jgi:hypothetical protein
MPNTFERYVYCELIVVYNAKMECSPAAKNTGLWGHVKKLPSKIEIGKRTKYSKY